METNKSIKLQFPINDCNPAFDGRIHIISPIELYSFQIENNNYYLLYYIENGEDGLTILGLNDNKQFYKIPLDNYNYLLDYLDQNIMRINIHSESLDELNNQDYINTIEVQNAEQVFLTGKLQDGAKVAAASQPNPPDPNNPPVAAVPLSPPNPPKTVAATLNPPDPQDEPTEEFEKEVELYIGFYGYSYAAFLKIKRGEKDIEENKYRYGRYIMNDKLDRSIIDYIHKYSYDKDQGDMHIDYGEQGELNHLIYTDLDNYTNITDENVYGNSRGKYKYKMNVNEFKNAEDFQKFKSSSRVECTATDDMFLRFHPLNHSSVSFL